MSNNLLKTLWFIVSVLLVTAFITPAVGTMIASYFDGQVLDLRIVFSYYSDLPSSYFLYFNNFNQASHMFGLIGSFIFSCILVTLLFLSSNQKNRDREVRNGILASEKVYSSSEDIKKRNLLWKPGTTPEQPGIVYGYLSGKYVYDNPVHAAIFGASGSLKSRASVIPSIILNASHGTSMLITDVKLELYAYCREFLENEGYTTLLLDVSHVTRGARINLLSLIISAFNDGDLVKCEDRTRELANSLVPDNGGENAIFERGAAGVLAAVIWLVVTSDEIPENDKHLWSVIKTILDGCQNDTDDLKQWIISYGSDNPAVSMAATFISSEGKLEAGILSELHSSLAPFTSQSMRWLLSENQIDITEAIHTKVAIFLHTLPDSPYNKIFTSFFNQWWDETLRASDAGNPARECFVIADEFGNLPKLSSLPSVSKLSRSYKFHYAMYCQSIEAFSKFQEGTYNGGSDIIANTSIRVLLTAGDRTTAEHFHMLGGQRTVLSRNSGESKSSRAEGTSQGYSETTVDNWPIASLMGRNPVSDGALVWKKKEPQSPKRAGKFEIPVADPTRGLKGILPTIGTPDHEASVISNEMKRLDEYSHNRDMSISVWSPDFSAQDEEDEEKNTEEDVFGI